MPVVVSKGKRVVCVITLFRATKNYGKFAFVASFSRRGADSSLTVPAGILWWDQWQCVRHVMFARINRATEGKI